MFNLNTTTYPEIDSNTVYTGYFAKIPDYKNAGFTSLIAITAFLPKKLSFMKKCTDILIDESPLQLAPDKDILINYKNDDNIAKYIRDYASILSKLDVHKVYNVLKGSILLCYESSNDFCHRHLITMWLRSHNYKADEYIIERK